MAIDRFDVVALCNVCAWLGRLEVDAIGSVLIWRLCWTWWGVGRSWEIVMSVWGWCGFVSIMIASVPVEVTMDHSE